MEEIENLKKIIEKLKKKDSPLNNKYSLLKKSPSESPNREVESLKKKIKVLVEEVESRENTISDLKNSLISITREASSCDIMEKEISRLLLDNERLRHHLLHLQKVFQERETELSSEVERLLSRTSVRDKKRK